MRLIILFLLIGVSLNSYSQKFLQIEKYGSMKVQKFYVGDELTYQIEGDKKNWYRGTINDLLVEENIILLENRAVKMKDITAIRTYKNAAFSRSMSLILYTFAAGFGGMTAVATLAGWWEITPFAIIAVGTALVAGLLIRQLFKWKTYKMGKRKWLRMLDITPSPVYGP